MSNDYVAIAEMIRNAYDAGARSVTVILTSSEPQKLIVFDNGSGMSLTDVQKSWMKPGYSEKGNSTRGRPNLGEKGIGRFAADKIAKRLVLTTKIASRLKATRVDFDWSRFENQKTSLTSIGIPYSEVHDEELIKIGHGTRMELIGLRRTWTKKEWNDLRNELIKLINPVAPTKGFRVFTNWAEGESGEIVPQFDGEVAYHYYFSIDKTGKIIWTLTRPKHVLRDLKAAGINAKKNESGTDHVPNIFGPANADFYYFEKPSAIKKQDLDAGIAIYRDQFRVEPYGRPEDDWLGVKSLGASRQGHAPITPSKLIGFIQITRKNNSALKDLTNRDGIQDSAEFESFQSAIKNRFDAFAEFVREDSRNLPKSPAFKAQKRNSARLTTSVAFGDMAGRLAHQLKQPMSFISGTADTLVKYLEKNFNEDAKLKKYVERIQKNILRLNSNIDGLASLATNLRNPTVDFDLVKFLNVIIENNRINFEARGVELTTDFQVSSAKVVFSKAALEFAVDNFLTNAMRAAAKNQNREKRVLVNLMEQKLSGFRIGVKDSGTGVSDSDEEGIFKEPLPNAEGSGMGLYYTKLLVQQFDGEVGYSRLGDGMFFYIDL